LRPKPQRRVKAVQAFLRGFPLTIR
jgi:hypothetical protein